MCLLHYIGGAFTHKPEELRDGLSQQAADLIKRSFEDIDPQRLLDYHTHIAGLGKGGTNAFINPKMQTWKHPLDRLKFKVYLSAGDVKDLEQADAQVVERLVRLVSNIEGHGRHRLLAFDKNYNRDGSANLQKTEFYVPNDYVFAIAEQYPDCFEPVMSVNPYRADAGAQLNAAPDGGRASSSGCPMRWGSILPIHFAIRSIKR